MLDGKIPERDMKIINEILGILDKRKDQYNQALISFAISKEDGKWKNNILTITLCNDKFIIPKEATLNYDDFIIGKRLLSVDQVREFIKNLIEKGEIGLSEIPNVKIECTFDGSSDFENIYVPSNQKLLDLGWPCNKYVFYGATGYVGRYHRALISLKCPLYPDSKAAIKDIIGIDLPKYDYFHGKILIFLPNYQAKIERIIVERSNLSLGIRSFILSKENIVGKLFIEYENESESKNIHFENDEVYVQLKSTPNSFYLYLLSSESGEVLDYRKVNLKYFPEDVILKISPEEYLEIIRTGESETVEFKGTLHKESRDEFLETVCSFSNTVGGLIFLGVNNNGKVIGVQEVEKYEDRIGKIIREKIEPVPKFNSETVHTEDSQFVVVRITQGSQKPYNFRDRGIFIRCNGTDRIATRHELDELYKKE